MRLIRCWLWYAATVSSTVSRIDRPRGDAMDAAIAGQERGSRGSEPSGFARGVGGGGEGGEASGSQEREEEEGGV